MWQILKKLGYAPSTASDDDIPIYTRGDTKGSIDLLCHEIRRRMVRESFLTDIYGTVDVPNVARIDYFERPPVFDFRDWPAMSIQIGAVKVDWGVGPVMENEFPILLTIFEDALWAEPVEPGAPTMRTHIADIYELYQSWGTFQVNIDGENVPTVRYSRPGNVQELVQEFPGTAQVPKRVNWMTRIPIIFEVVDNAVTQVNLNVGIVEDANP